MAKRRPRKQYSKRELYKFKKSLRKRSSRDFKHPEYVLWRKNIRERDKGMCQWPGCCSKKRLQVHHIKTWANNPGLRFAMGNGITLCSKCHDSVKGKEVFYEAFFLKLLEWQMIDKIKSFTKKNKQEKEDA